MLDLTSATNATSRAIIRWVAKDPIRQHPVHQALEVGNLLGIATHQPVFAEQPDVTSPRCSLLRKSWNGVDWLRRRRGHVCEQQINFRRFKACQRDIESFGRQ